jgi:type I restriction enzyme M protein
VEDKNKKLVWAEEHDVEIGNRRFKSDSLPRIFLVEKYFAAEQKNIEVLEAAADAIAATLEELTEKTNEDGELIFEDAKNDKDKITAASVKDRLKKIKNDKDAGEEIKELNAYLKLSEEQTEANKKIKAAKAELEKLLLAKYAALTETEIKNLVVDDKWMATLEHSVKNEMQRISQRLTQRIKELAERYETPMSSLMLEVNQWEEKVNTHLTKMGFAWS